MGVSLSMNPEDDRGERINPRRNCARALRHNATETERELWWHLRRKLPLGGTHFRRQAALGPYVVDFACLKHRLVVELDGGQHALDDVVRHDAVRTAYLETMGLQVLRFWNNEVFTNMDGVLETIRLALAPTPPPPTPPLKGEGRGREGRGRAADGRG